MIVVPLIYTAKSEEFSGYPETGFALNLKGV